MKIRDLDAVRTDQMRHNIAFSVPIFAYSIENWSDHKEEILSLMELDKEEFHETDYFKFHRNGIQPTYASKFFEIISPALDEFNGIYPNKFTISNCWAQKYSRGCLHPLHNHGALGYSAIFYASLESDHQPTSFFAPYLDFIEGDVIEYVPQVSEGDIVFFPSALMHQCNVVQSDLPRVIISFNIKNA